MSLAVYGSFNKLIKTRFKKLMLLEIATGRSLVGEMRLKMNNKISLSGLEFYVNALYVTTIVKYKQTQNNRVLFWRARRPLPSHHSKMVPCSNSCSIAAPAMSCRPIFVPSGPANPLGLSVCADHEVLFDSLGVGLICTKEQPD